MVFSNPNYDNLCYLETYSPFSIKCFISDDLKAYFLSLLNRNLSQRCWKSQVKNEFSKSKESKERFEEKKGMNNKAITGILTAQTDRIHGLLREIEYRQMST